MKSASLSQKAYAALMFLAVSALSGLLLSGLAAPITALAAGAIKIGSENLENLPAEFETPPQAQRSRVLMADGSVLATFYNENRVYVGLDKISENMQKAQVAIEDHRFYEHGAIDLQGIGRAFVRTMSGETQGASTLTQQYVKLVRVQIAAAAKDEKAKQEATEVSLNRKILELRYALGVEEKLSKKEILERYLNIAYYGDGAYGVEAAAYHYFGTTAEKLTLAQAALLSGIVKNPVKFNPAINPEEALERRDLVLDQMVKWKMATKEEAEEAKKVKFDKSKIIETPNGCVSSKFPHICDYVSRTLLSDKMSSLGNNKEERQNLLLNGGLTIQTLIDPAAQAAAEKAVTSLIAPTDPVIATSVLMQPGTGLIVAMAQSRPERGKEKGQTYWNYNVEYSMGGAEGYQAGSTFKPFAMAAAIEKGYTPSKEYDSPRNLSLQGMRFKNCSGSFKFSEDHTVKNYDTGYGVIDMMKATQNSVNTYYLQLERDIGICTTIDMAAKLGVKMANGDDLRSQQNYPTFVLGTAEVTPLSMAEAYATFAARGKHCDPIILKSVTGSEGKKIGVPSANCKQVMDQTVADGVSYVLQSVIRSGTGFPARMYDGRPQAGKTGTTDSNEAVWFAGYTPEMAGIAMLSIDKTNDWYKTHRKSLKGVSLPSGTYLRGSGGGDAGKIWRAAMTSALKDAPKTGFKTPAKHILLGVRVSVPSVSGMNYDQAKKTLEEAGFTALPWYVYNDAAKGTFLGLSVSGTAVKFSTIRLKVSKGPKPEPVQEQTSTETEEEQAKEEEAATEEEAAAEEEE